MSHRKPNPRLNPSIRALEKNSHTVQVLAPPVLIHGRVPFTAPFSFGQALTKPIDYPTVAQIIRQCSLPNAAFYPDTCFFTGEEKPVELWDSLLERQIVIAPFIWQELQAWLENPFRNKYMRDRLLDASLSSTRRVQFDPEKNISENQRIGSRYYIDLLAVRRRLGAILANEFQTKHGREPDAQEFDRLVQCSVAENEHLLVRKGRTDIKKATFFADDQLVPQTQNDLSRKLEISYPPQTLNFEAGD